MADAKISDLSAITTAASTDQLVAVQGGVTKKIVLSKLTESVSATNIMATTTASFANLSVSAGSVSNLGITGSTAAVHINIIGTTTSGVVIAGNAFTGTQDAGGAAVLTIVSGIVISSS